MKNINHKFDAKKFKLGMRTFKTGLSVFLVILLFKLFGLEGAQIGALTAVFSLREDVDRSISFGLSRIIGNTIGGVLALIVVFLNVIFNGHFLVALIGVPVATMLCIMLNVAFNNKAGIIGGSSALLIITLLMPADSSSYIYAVARVFETFLGVFVAILVNSDIEFIKNKINRLKK